MSPKLSARLETETTSAVVRKYLPFPCAPRNLFKGWVRPLERHASATRGSKSETRSYLVPNMKWTIGRPASTTPKRHENSQTALAANTQGEIFFASAKRLNRV